MRSKNRIPKDLLRFFSIERKKLGSAQDIKIDEFRIITYQKIIDQYLSEDCNIAKADTNKAKVLSQNKKTTKTEKDNKRSVKSSTRKNHKNNGTESKQERKKKSTEKRKRNKVSTKGNETSRQFNCIRRVENTEIVKPTDNQQFPVLICPNDFEQVHCENVAKRSDNYKVCEFAPLYRCSICGGRYTNINRYCDGYPVHLSGYDYINLVGQHHINSKCKQSKKMVNVRKKLPCYVYKKRIIGCRNPECNNAKLITINAKEISTNGKEFTEPYKLCRKCGLIYVPFSVYTEKQDILECVNPHELSVINAGMEKRRQKKERQKQENQTSSQKSNKKKGNNVRKRENDNQGVSPVRIKNSKRKVEETTQKSAEIKRNVEDITIKDCIVRRNVFKCRHKDHSLKNVNAAVAVIDSTGHIQRVTISAGYCPECDLFFIIESNFQALRSKGIPMCRVSNERAYLNSINSSKQMKLAPQSILMQYGYNVSQKEGLTDIQRRKILSTLVDQEIMTKGEIISYLDFFIYQRWTQSKYNEAISKWRSDEHFISDYEMEKYHCVAIHKIIRKY